MVDVFSGSFVLCSLVSKKFEKGKEMRKERRDGPEVAFVVVSSGWRADVAIRGICYEYFIISREVARRVVLDMFLRGLLEADELRLLLEQIAQSTLPNGEEEAIAGVFGDSDLLGACFVPPQWMRLPQFLDRRVGRVGQ